MRKLFVGVGAAFVAFVFAAVATVITLTKRLDSDIFNIELDDLEDS